MTTQRSRQRGNAGLEMALIFVPFVLGTLGTMELARAMWMYHTLTTAVKSAARRAVIHGADCLAASDSCPATVRDLARTVQQSGVGLDASQLRLTFTADGSSYSCTLSSCVSDDTQWPPSSHNQPGIPIDISALYTFQSVLSSFWPGQGPASFTYQAESSEVIQF